VVVESTPGAAIQAPALRLAAGRAAVFDGQGQLTKEGLSEPERFERRIGFTNVARGKPILPGSQSWSGEPGAPDPRYQAPRAVDGQVSDEIGTFWLARHKVEGDYFTVDLGAEHELGWIEIVQTHNGRENDRATKNYEVWAAAAVTAVTAEGELIAPVSIASGVLPNAANQPLPLPVEVVQVEGVAARYVKFVATNYYVNGAGLSELRVFGKLRPGSAK
jgi:hypothetical protein